ncbi:MULTISPECIES: hypothetical protein [unclassified Streptomyces]|uniref:hypothetical protein n=1 Tax=unclassified Streptomyces TaxID=2593676 RepID=UPI000F44839A|nr:hypothetical protein [Streptomyces sp. I6]RNL70667.1 hypothetical protein EBF04_05390 [Streptomyces sp. I6]
MRRLPCSLSGWTMAVFGVLAAVMGLAGLVSPDLLLAVLGLGPGGEPVGTGADGHTAAFVTASSMAALNMGVYYVLAALSDWKPFFRWTVPFRLLTFLVFLLAVLAGRAPAPFLGIAVWEGLGALATGLALRFDARRPARG